MTRSLSANALETEPIPRLMRRYALPCVISLLVGALYNLVDQLFIANAPELGSVGNAANSVVFPLTVIALATATMIGDGCCVLVSLRLGAGDRETAARCVGSAVTLTLGISLLLTAVYLGFADPILTAFGGAVNTETMALSKEYFFWIALGIPFYMGGQALNPIVRSDGSPRFAMFSLTAGAAANCLLDPLFIYGFHWGMTGAAVATVIGQMLSALLTFAYLLRPRMLKLQKSSFRPSPRLCGQCLSLGLSSFLSQISIVLSMAAVLNVCRIYGSRDPIFGQAAYAHIPTAVIGIVMKLFQIVMSIAVGLSAGCIPLVGYNTGANRPDRVKALLRCLLLAEGIVGLLAAGLLEGLPLPLIRLFGADRESPYYTAFALRCMRLFFCTAPLACLNKGTFIFLQALGRPRLSSGLSLFREVGCGVGLVLLLPLRFGLDGMLYFMPAADILTFFIAVAVLICLSRRIVPKC